LQELDWQLNATENLSGDIDFLTSSIHAVSAKISDKLKELEKRID
jgi:hypothetical protein